MADRISTNVQELLLAALERGNATTTGRQIVTMKEGAADAGMQQLASAHGFRVASSRDFESQAVRMDDAGDADALVFPEIGVVVVSGESAQDRGITAESFDATDSPFESIDPEYFMFAHSPNPADYLKGFLRAAQTISSDLGLPTEEVPEPDVDPEAEVLGITWGLNACRVKQSSFNGSGIRVAVLDTGFDLGHPEFAGRSIVSATFTGQPVQDLNGHGTHTAGTAAGPLSPAGSVPRYGIAHRSQLFIGKVLDNSGSGTMASVLAGINWAIANGCQVISMSLGASIGVQPAYTSAGASALGRGLLIIAAAGNESNRPATIRPTGAPANSPTVMSVGALTEALRVASFSNGGKVDIAAPGVNTFSSWPRPLLHRTISGTSMATPHVAGCAALWAQSNPSLRGLALRAKLQASARRLRLPASDVGAGLVQAP